MGYRTRNDNNHLRSQKGVSCFDCNQGGDWQVEQVKSGENGDANGGFAHCSLDDTTDEELVKKSDCISGVCFIRGDQNGMVYRGCADDWNLPLGVNTTDQCQWQGSLPSFWWFCSGHLCNRPALNVACGKSPPAVTREIGVVPADDDGYQETVHGDTAWPEAEFSSPQQVPASHLPVEEHRTDARRDYVHSKSLRQSADPQDEIVPLQGVIEAGTLDGHQTINAFIPVALLPVPNKHNEKSKSPFAGKSKSSENDKPDAMSKNIPGEVLTRKLVFDLPSQSYIPLSQAAPSSQLNPEMDAFSSHRKVFHTPSNSYQSTKVFKTPSMSFHLEPSRKSNQPIEAYDAPSKSHQPVKAYDAPSKSYQPVKAYDAPSKSYQPVKAYDAPSKSHQPVKAYDAPSKSHQPVKAYDAPSKSHQPVKAYDVPSKPYQPVKAYDAPSKSYQPVEAYDEILVDRFGKPFKPYHHAETYRTPSQLYQLDDNYVASSKSYQPVEKHEAPIAPKAPKKSYEPSKFYQPIGKYDAPSKSYQPVEKYDAPKKTDQPVERYEEPSKSYQPIEKFDAPSKSYQPIGKYDAPSKSNQSVEKYDAPSKSYQPIEKYEVPSNSYQPFGKDAPSKSYQPIEQFDAPSKSYQPIEKYEAPSKSYLSVEKYDTPSKSYQSVEKYNVPSKSYQPDALSKSFQAELQLSKTPDMLGTDSSNDQPPVSHPDSSLNPDRKGGWESDEIRSSADEYLGLALPTVLSSPCDSQCHGNPSGLFAHPLTPVWYIQCGAGIRESKPCQCCTPYYMKCPLGTSFDSHTLICSQEGGSVNDPIGLHYG